MSESAQQPLVADTKAVERTNATTEEPVRKERARKSAYRSRFNAIYVALALAAGVAIGAFVVVAFDDEQPKTVVASPSTRFKPSETGELGAMQIAELVQHKYRLADGSEFVNVIASRNTLQDSNLGFLRVRYQVFRPADEAKEKDSTVEIPDDAIQYSLCGSGPNCTIPGEPTVERGLLLRGMGLELALRTLKFDPEVDNVTVFLRPIPPQQSDGVVLVFRRNTLDRVSPALLRDSLQQTLPSMKAKVQPGQLSVEAARRIESVTRSHLYYGTYQLLGGRDALLQLRPVPKG